MARKRDNTIHTQNAAGRDRIGMWLYLLYGVILIVSVFIIYRIIYYQYIWQPDPKLVEEFRPAAVKKTVQPMRGSIISSDGHVFVMDEPRYKIEFDCHVLYEDYLGDGTKEAEWLSGAKSICPLLAELYGTETRPRRNGWNADRFYQEIRKRRYAQNGHVFTVAEASDYDRYHRLMEHEFARKGQYRSGIIVTVITRRQYPHDPLAHSLFGFENTSTGEFSTEGNIEMQMSRYLEGTPGIEYLRKTDKNALIPDFTRRSVKVVDGMDVRTTLNFELQSILDAAMRSNINSEKYIEAGTAILMEVETGAVRALVNLQRDNTRKDSLLLDNVNVAFTRTGEPGSVFKSVSSMVAISTGYVTSMFNEMVPTTMKYSKYGFDKHIAQYEDRTGSKEMPMSVGLQESSNNVFAYITTKYFDKHPQDFYDKLGEWNFGRPIMTDIGPTRAGSLNSKAEVEARGGYWSPTNLGSAGYGYSVNVTPMHIATFYNAIANDGKMMRPYFVERIEKDGEVVRRTEPEVIVQVCTPAQADTLTSSLKLVTDEGGTAEKVGKATRDCNVKIAGKTGTSQIYITGVGYKTAAGRQKNQGTFVCFFPADRPKYTLLVTMYVGPDPIRKSLWGSGYPAQVAIDAIRGIYAVEPSEHIAAAGEIPGMKAPSVAEETEGAVPDVKGLALKDALYELERRGYAVRHSGIGHVHAMSPKAGTPLAKGKTVTLTLK